MTTTSFSDWLFDFWGCNEEAAPHKHLLGQLKNNFELVAEAVFNIGYTKELLHALLFQHRAKLVEPAITSPAFLFRVDIQATLWELSPHERQIITGILRGEDLWEVGKRAGESNPSRSMDRILDRLTVLLGEPDATAIP